jgi:DNA-directed RNA polymerase subunit beta
VNEYGFIETPYRKVEAEVTDEVKFYSALEEEGQSIAQANAQVTTTAASSRRASRARKTGEFQMTPAEQIEMMDVSPNQLVSVAASLIPFLEHDDANRALMVFEHAAPGGPAAANAGRRWSAPGMEAVVARDSGVTVVASATASVVSVRREPHRDQAGRGRRHRLERRHHQPDQVPALQPEHLHQPEADRAARPSRAARSVIADGPATETGELALGPQTWSSRSCRGAVQLRGLDPHLRARGQDDIFTSIHIEEFECVARDTKLGKEEITRDIPNVGEEALKDLDESGIVRIGAEVKPATSSSARSRRRARRSSRPRRSCCARSSARRPATCATRRCACRRASPAS